MKKFIKGFLALSMIASLSLVTPAYASNTMKVHLNGKEMKFNVDPVVTNNTTMVEFRPLFEQMGLQVVWTPDNPTQIIGKKDGLSITLHIGSKITMVNGKEVDLTVAPQVVNNHTLVPLRFVGEASGKVVKWTGGNDVEINDLVSGVTTTPNPSVSTSSNLTGETSAVSSSTNNVTPPSYALKNLQVYWNGKEMFDRSHKVTSFYSSRDAKWYVYFEDIFGSLTGSGNISTKKTDKGRIMIAKYDQHTYQFSDNDGSYVDNIKVESLKFVDYTAAPIDTYANALNFTYTVDENGVYITSK